MVPRADSTTEGDGWILAFTYDALHDRSELVIIDAEHFAGRPVAAVQLPRRVPAGLHGTWLPADQHGDVDRPEKLEQRGFNLA